MLDPYIESFRAQAERLDEIGAPYDTDLPIALLALFMRQAEGLLSEEEMFALAEIGAHLYREDLRRSMIRQVK